MWKWLQTLRGVRIINVLVGLFFSVHLLACGFYMCAALHAEVEALSRAFELFKPGHVAGAPLRRPRRFAEPAFGRRSRGAVAACHAPRHLQESKT